MIEKLTIRNFKSIKDFDIQCRRINLFIGEPNTGKSNILETLALFSWIGHHNVSNSKLVEYIRFEELQDLFYDGLMEEKIEVIVNRKDIFSTEITFDNDNFKMKTKIDESKDDRGESLLELELDYSGDLKRYAEPENINPFSDAKHRKSIEDLKNFNFSKYYKFLKQSNFPVSFPAYLLPPYGSNLLSLVRGKKKIREIMHILTKDLNLNFMLKPMDKKIELVKQKDELIFSYPYITASDTLQRIIFFSIAMESNQNATLIFEEPESFAFPYYTKYLGERIAFDESNQYFISTHNPYLLLAILEKSPNDAVNVFITYLEEYQTKVKVLTEDEITVLMDSDPFFNLGYFLEEE